MMEFVRNIVNIWTRMFKKEPNKSFRKNQKVQSSSLRIISWTFSTHFALCDLEYKSDDSLTLINRQELKFKHTEKIEIKAPPARIHGISYRVVIFQAVCLWNLFQKSWTLHFEPHVKISLGPQFWIYKFECNFKTILASLWGGKIVEASGISDASVAVFIQHQCTTYIVRIVVEQLRKAESKLATTPHKEF